MAGEHESPGAGSGQINAGGKGFLGRLASRPLIESIWLSYGSFAFKTRNRDPMPSSYLPRAPKGRTPPPIHIRRALILFVQVGEREFLFVNPRRETKSINE